MGWVCSGCGSENSFQVRVCRACGYKMRPVHLAGERLATVRDRLQANQFDFLGRSLEERAWDRAGQAIGVWRSIFPYVLAVEAVCTAIVMLFSGMPGPFSRLPGRQSAVVAAYQVFLDRGELAWESLLYDWRPEEERVQATMDGLRTFTENATAGTGELTWRAREDWSASGEAVAALKPRLRARFHFARVTDRVKESGTLALGGSRVWSAVPRPGSGLRSVSRNIKSPSPRGYRRSQRR